jgi:hypothetical protein
MRRIVDRRRAVIGELVATASAAARDAGHPVGSPVLRQLEETLEAAVADEGSAAALRGGRLSEPLRFVGFGPSSTPDPGAAGTAGTKTAKDKSPRRHKDTEPSQAAAREAREAREARRVLQAAVAAAEAHRDAAGERYRRAVAELGAAEDDRAAAGAALREARRALARATRRAGT